MPKTRRNLSKILFLYSVKQWMKDMWHKMHNLKEKWESCASTAWSYNTSDFCIKKYTFRTFISAFDNTGTGLQLCILKAKWNLGGSFLTLGNMNQFFNSQTCQICEEQHCKSNNTPVQQTTWSRGDEGNKPTTDSSRFENALYLLHSPAQQGGDQEFGVNAQGLTLNMAGFMKTL